MRNWDLLDWWLRLLFLAAPIACAFGWFFHPMYPVLSAGLISFSAGGFVHALIFCFMISPFKHHFITMERNWLWFFLAGLAMTFCGWFVYPTYPRFTSTVAGCGWGLASTMVVLRWLLPACK